MAEILSFGLKKMEVAEIDPITHLPGEWKDIGDIFKDTCDLTEAEPTLTPIFAEQGATARKVFSDPGEETLKFSLMSTHVDSLISVLNGSKVVVSTAATVGGVVGNNVVDRWKKPEGVQSIEKAFKITTIDDTVITINRGNVVGKKNYQFRRQGILLTDVIVSILEPRTNTLDAMTIDNPPTFVPTGG